MSVENIIVEYLDEARQMQVATCVDGQPWCTTVYFAHDNAHNLYWISMPDARHSQEIVRNPQVAGAITLAIQPGQPVRGLQFSGTAQEIDLAHVRSNIEAYAERYERFTLGEDIVRGTVPIRLYQIKPTSFILFDQQNFPQQPHQEWTPGQSAVE